MQLFFVNNLYRLISQEWEKASSMNIKWHLVETVVRWCRYGMLRQGASSWSMGQTLTFKAVTDKPPCIRLWKRITRMKSSSWFRWHQMTSVVSACFSYTIVDGEKDLHGTVHFFLLVLQPINQSPCPSLIWLIDSQLVIATYCDHILSERKTSLFSGHGWWLRTSCPLGRERRDVLCWLGSRFKST